MKKYIKLIGIILIILVLYFVFNRYYSTNNVPSFKYFFANNASFSKENLPKDKYTIFVYFSTECNDCKMINDYLEYFKSKNDSVNFVLIAKGNDSKKLIDFIDTNKMSNFRGYLLLDKEDNFPSDFALGISFSFPVIKAYDKNGILLENIKTLGDIKKI
jgi:thiol-disulfide isomerase/thioredoxin